MAKSFKQMRLDGDTKRSEAAFIELHNIHFDPDFNAVGRNDENDEEDEELFQFIMAGHFDQLPAWEVIPRDGGGVLVVEGHRRTIQTRRALAAGAPLQDKDGKVWVPIKPFVGNDLDRLYRVGTSGKQKLLKMHQFANLCKRARGFNQSPADIALRMCVSRAKVDQALMFADANHDVQEAVKAGTISATEAIKQVRKHGEKAGEVIKEAVAQVATAKPTKANAGPGKTAPVKPPKKVKVTAAAFVPAGPNAQQAALSRTLFAVHAVLAPYVENGANMHIDDIKKLQGIVAAGLRTGAA